MDAPWLLYQAAGSPPQSGELLGICRICGRPGAGIPFNAWVRETFTDHDKLKSGAIICHACQFCFAEASAELAKCVGKDKPQRMRNYSHFVVDGSWTALSKGDKARMRELLLGKPFPELAVIAESGQKHIIFRARTNALGAVRGYVQFEESTLFITPRELRENLALAERLYAGFSKAEIETGRYNQRRILDFGIRDWTELENAVRRRRQTPLFHLALFLAQRSEDGDGGIETADGEAVDDHLAGDTAGLQAQIHEHLAAVRGQRQERGLHQQPGESHQLALW